jgi:hypothetical protein
MLQRTNIYLEPETIQFYKKKASQRGVSMAEEMRMVINRKIENEKKDWKQSMKSMIDNAGEGPEDLSQNHDEYLY